MQNDAPQKAPSKLLCYYYTTKGRLFHAQVNLMVS